MPKLLRNKTLRKILIVLGIILGTALVVYLIVTGRRYFSRRGIRQIQTLSDSYGALSPLVIFALIFISTIIPPLPIPTPLIEMATGYIYGFWPAFFLVWVSQIISSIASFAIARYVGKRIFKGLLNNSVVVYFQKYIRQHGAMAVFITRTTLSSPFTIVSFLAGFTDMSTVNYTSATVLGTIAESGLYAFVGSIIKGTKLRLWFVFIFVVLLGSLGPLVTYLIMKYAKPRKRIRST